MLSIVRQLKPRVQLLAAIQWDTLRSEHMREMALCVAHWQAQEQQEAKDTSNPKKRKSKGSAAAAAAAQAVTPDADDTFWSDVALQLLLRSTHRGSCKPGYTKLWGNSAVVYWPMDTCEIANMGPGKHESLQSPEVIADGHNLCMRIDRAEEDGCKPREDAGLHSLLALMSDSHAHDASAMCCIHTALCVCSWTARDARQLVCSRQMPVITTFNYIAQAQLTYHARDVHLVISAKHSQQIGGHGSLPGCGSASSTYQWI